MGRHQVAGFVVVMVGAVWLLGSPVLAQGAATLFQDKCTPCHGDNGKGDGPAAVAYSPRPRDGSFRDRERTRPTSPLASLAAG